MLPRPQPEPKIPQARPRRWDGRALAMTGLQTATTMPPPMPWMLLPTRRPAKLELSPKTADPTTKQPQQSASKRPPQRAAATPDKMPETP